MSIKKDGLLTKDSLNKGFISKTAPGRQIMAGSLKMLGSLDTEAIKASGAIDAQGNQIKTTGRIDAGTFYGSGAGITGIPAGNISGTIAKGNLPSSVAYEDEGNTFTLDQNFTGKIYLGGGTTYYIGGDGAYLSNTEIDGDFTIHGGSLEFNRPSTPSGWSRLIAFNSADGSTQYGGFGMYGSGEEVYKMYMAHGDSVYNSGLGIYVEPTGHTGIGTAYPEEMLDVQGNAIVRGVLESADIFGHGSGNEFPDPTIASGSPGNFDVWDGAMAFDAAQKPPGIDAYGSVKFTSSVAGGWFIHSHDFPVEPSEWITFSTYAFCTTTGNSGEFYIYFYDSAGSRIDAYYETHVVATSWERYSSSTQVPVGAVHARIGVDNEGPAGTIMYFSGIQFERGKAMSKFSPYAGSGSGVSMSYNSLKLGPSGSIKASHNDQGIIIDHGNGNITLSAAGGSLYLGYQNTDMNLLYANLYSADRTKLMASTDGALYYKGDHTDDRYFKKRGDTFTGVATFTGGINAYSKITATEGGYYSGTHHFNSNSNSTPLTIGRGPSTTDEKLSIGIDDSDLHFHYLNDETVSRMRFIVENNDMESGGGAAASYYEPLVLYGSGGSWGVGIGTSSPSRNLHVAGTAMFNDSIQVGVGSSANDFLVSASGTLNFRNTLWADGSKVGVGTTTPSHPLDVVTNINHQGINLQTTDNLLSNGISLQNAGGAYTWSILREDVGGSRADLVFRGGNDVTMSQLPEIIRFGEDGNIGINNSSPARRLDVNGDSRVSGILTIEAPMDSHGVVINKKYDSPSEPAALVIQMDNDGGNIPDDIAIEVRGAAAGSTVSTSDTTFTVFSSGAVVMGREVSNGYVMPHGSTLEVSGHTSMSGHIFLNGNNLNEVRYINGMYGEMIRSNDEWLRINENGSHTSGTYFGSTVVRTDGSLQVGGNGSDVLLNSNGVQVKDKFRMEYNAAEDSLDFVYLG